MKKRQIIEIVVLCVCVVILVIAIQSQEFLSTSMAAQSQELVTTPKFTQSLEFWPPRLEQEYPDFKLIDQTGEKVRISDFKGSLLLIEYVGMNCAACQAFSGANTHIGPFENNTVQRGLKSIKELFPTYTNGLSLSDNRITFIQILLYDMKRGAPTPEDAQRWAQHFQLEKSRNQYVLVPIGDMRGSASYNLIPGFQLVDKNFILKSDSTGHHPRVNLSVLLSMAPRLINAN